MRIICVVGTRPNFVKLGSLYKEMQGRAGIEPILLHTGQHYDANMSASFFQDLGLPKPDISLGISGGTHAAMTAHIMLEMEPVLNEFKADAVVVVGDVNSTLAAALVASKAGVPLAHVEAGLRSGDRTMPEELNRICTDQLADFLFVTEQSGITNLIREGVPPEKIFLVGNVMIDTLMMHVKRARQNDLLQRFGLKHNEYVLATLHRPANTDNRDVLADLLKALGQVSGDMPVLLPLHPRTKSRIAQFDLQHLLNGTSNIMITEPFGYIDFLSAMMNAKAVFTDSGGIQEETTILGIPCLTMRDNTERPVTIECGSNRLVGTSGAKVVAAWKAIHDASMQHFQKPPLWDGRASQRIVDILISEISRTTDAAGVAMIGAEVKT